MNTQIKTPTWFTVVAILAIIWNLMGIMAYLAQAFMPPEALESLKPEVQEAYRNVPAWATAAFALSVFGGFFGSLFLLLKKNIAKILLWISLISIIINDFYNFIMIDSISLFGMSALYMQIIVLIVAILLVYLFNQAKNKHWIK